MSDNTVKTHLLKSDIAKLVGVNASLIFEKFRHFSDYHSSNGTNQNDGRTWVYYSHKALSQQFEYLTSRQIRTALDKLLSEGLIVKGNYNKFKNDRTLWYSVVDDFHMTSKSNATNDSQVISTYDFKVTPLPKDTKETQETFRESAGDVRAMLNDIFDQWNAMASVNGLATVNKQNLNPNRKAFVLKRLKDCGGDLSLIVLAISNVPNNPHWLGNNNRGWRADFDWVFKTANFPKVLEYTEPTNDRRNNKSSKPDAITANRDRRREVRLRVLEQRKNDRVAS